MHPEKWSRTKKRKSKQQGFESEDSDDDLITCGGDMRPPAGRRPPTTRNWENINPGLVGSKVPEYIKPVLDAEDQATFENLDSAFDYYLLFQSDSFVNELIYQYRLYAIQKGYKISLDRIGKDIYRCTEAILLHSGYNDVPRRKMLWEKKKDCYNSLVAENIRRNDVDAMLHSLHFRDNILLDDDPYFNDNQPSVL
ncbi:MAG: hypothetical protein GY696_14680 [Gammaproteobacteria bacterium]|nr:hypothetical protein [Gammaproteobacteria bacterium]